MITEKQILKLKIGKFKIPVTIEPMNNNRLKLVFPYNKEMINEVKCMEGAHWAGYDEDKPGKYWSIINSQRNLFQLDFLSGGNPYSRYDSPTIDYNSRRDLYAHQGKGTQFVLTRMQCILAYDTGVGKTLIAIESLEELLRRGILYDYDDIVWVGPRSALIAVYSEFSKWKTKLKPKFMTYESLRNYNGKIPSAVVYDEAQKIKTPTAQRSQAAKQLADQIREKKGDLDKCLVLLMSGTPAPKSPMDWFHLCISKDTWIFTNKGPKQVKDLIGQKFCTRVDNRTCFSTDKGFYYTGKKEVFEIVTKQGYKVKTTENHKFLTDYNGQQFWIPLNKLKIGDTLVINKHDNFEWEGEGSFREGYILGLIYSDGYISAREGITKSGYDTTIILQDRKIELLNYLLNLIGDEVTYNQTKDNKCIRINSIIIDKIREQFGIDERKIINEYVESSSSDFLIGFLSSFFDMDGTIEHDRLRIQLGQADLKRLEAIQRILLYFGIQSTIFKGHDAHETIILNRKVNLQDYYLLTITKENVKTFYQRIGFQISWKQNLLKENLKIKSYKSNKDFKVTIKKINLIGLEEVYDCTIPEISCFSGNGLILHNCEVACPGFLREGNVNAFRNRLALVKSKESITGGMYPELVTWWDNEKKCAICGKLEEENPDHDVEMSMMVGEGNVHSYRPSKNEVSYLYQRLKGLVDIVFKKDCLALPEKVYRIIECKPNSSMLRAAQMIANTAKNAITAMTLLRELSDGFQYKETKIPDQKEECPLCNGTKETNFPELHTPCVNCNATGVVDKYLRTSETFKAPKDSALIDLLEEYEDVGRVVIAAGFTGSIDKIVDLVKKEGWSYIRVDGRGWHSDLMDYKNGIDMVTMFQEYKDLYPKVAFITQPSSGGTGLTLTASPVVIFYSNDFNGDSRFQMEDRIHRISMDNNRGATIIDLVCLESDRKVMTNLQKKKDLQSMTLGDFQEAINSQADRVI